MPEGRSPEGNSDFYSLRKTSNSNSMQKTWVQHTDYYAVVFNSHGTWLHIAFPHTVVVLLGFPKGIKVSIAQGAQPRGQY